MSKIFVCLFYLLWSSVWYQNTRLICFILLGYYILFRLRALRYKADVLIFSESYFPKPLIMRRVAGRMFTYFQRTAWPVRLHGPCPDLFSYVPGNRLGYTLWASQLNPIIISKFILINLDIYWPKLYYRNLSILLLMIHVLSLACFVFVTHLESMDTTVVYCRSKYSLNLRIMNNYCSHKKSYLW